MRGVRRQRLALLLVAGSLGLAREAAADPPFDVSGATTGPPAPSGTEPSTVARYWELGRPRSFLAGAVEVGFAYVRPRFAAGYGQPYWRWVGVEAYPVLSLTSVGQYFGVGAAWPGISVRAGARYQYPFTRTLLEPREHFERKDIAILDTNRADYVAWEAEATLTFPSVLGSTFAVLTGEHLEFVPQGQYLFEDSLRVVIAPPWVWRARLGHLVGFGRHGALRIGAAGDLIGLPGRDSFVVRAGLLASVQLTSRLEAQASFIPVIVSPDSLGLAGGDFGQLGVRYRFATGSQPVIVRRQPAPEPSPGE